MNSRIEHCLTSELSVMVEELGQFLLPPHRIDVRAVALAQVLGLTGSPEGVSTLRTSPSLLQIIVRLALDPAEVLATDACLALINLSADVSTVPTLLEVKDIVSNLYKVGRRAGLGAF